MLFLSCPSSIVFLKFCLQVELAHGGRGQSSLYDRHSSYSSGGGSRGGVSRRSDYRGMFLTEVGLLSSSTLIFVLILSFQWLCFAVLVTGLPSSASWQDLKVNFQVQMCYTLTSRLILHF